MGDWSSLSELLDKVQAHSTVVGKIWMSVLLVFRILVLGVAADEVWGDEQSHFFCNNEEPGCTLACYNWMFPVSYIRYWVLQILLVSTPTLVYLGHAVHVIHRERRLRERLQGHDKGAADALRKPKYTDDRGKIVIKGILLRSYLAQLVVKILLEVGFVVGQFYLYDSPFMVPYFHCREDPCPPRIGVECFISRPTEKSIFVVFMLVVAGVSVFLNLLEILYLLCARKRQGQKKKRAALTNQEHYLSGKDLKLSGAPTAPWTCTRLTPPLGAPTAPWTSTRLTPPQGPPRPHGPPPGSPPHRGPNGPMDLHHAHSPLGAPMAPWTSTRLTPPLGAMDLHQEE
ncbi:gap junction Cx32.2 protein-like [Gadus chalcogrammus]|uniref:gap junction Cx32.2 protein-like n=1 Tax=Gadus chalcogrammus TaxID=1042646 RepID=UPI0024C4DDCE|nr:gap junction Cx32.2 protein-like [Gadus chalcogrammus]